MTIRLMNTSDAPNVVSKTTTTVAVLEGTLRAKSSIVNPIITIERASPAGFNYFYIPEFSRYYFLTDSVTDYTGIVTISGHVDVLKSFDSQIRSSHGIAVRNENVWNQYLDDGTYKVFQNPAIKITRFPYEFTKFSYIFALSGN